MVHISMLNEEKLLYIYVLIIWSGWVPSLQRQILEKIAGAWSDLRWGYRFWSTLPNKIPLLHYLKMIAPTKLHFTRSSPEAPLENEPEIVEDEEEAEANARKAWKKLTTAEKKVSIILEFNLATIIHANVYILALCRSCSRNHDNSCCRNYYRKESSTFSLRCRRRDNANTRYGWEVLNILYFLVWRRLLQFHL